MGTCFSYGREELRELAPRLNQLKKVVLIGSGTMGIGIAIDLLDKARCEITLIDISDKALDRAKREIGEYYAERVKEKKLTAEQGGTYCRRVSYSKDYTALGDAEIIWEVATEEAKIKKSIFEKIEQHADFEKLLLVFSNTSAHTTAELAELFTIDKWREKFLTGHGYFPFESNRLFDVMKGQYASEETFLAGVTFAEQVLEKKVVALHKDHHGYVTDPIFQAMTAIVSWDVKTAHDIVTLPLVFKMLTANPFQVLDQTGHMPYTKSANHFKNALPDDDRLRSLYQQGGKCYPQWIEDLETAGRIGVNTEEKAGFFKWDGPPRSEKPVQVYNPATKQYSELAEINWQEFRSIKEAGELDRKQGTIKSIEGLIHVAKAADKGGLTFRRYVLPLMLYGLDLIQDGFATAADVDTSTKVGLRFKSGLIEIIDGFIKHFGIDGFCDFICKAAEENPDRRELFDLEGRIAPRQGKPCLLLEMKAKSWTSLLGYGRAYGTPVSQRNIASGEMEAYYNDLRYLPPTKKDRVGTIIFDNSLRGNVWNKYLLDQFDHALGQAVKLYEKGELGAMLFTASGVNMRMLGADARQFSRGWFDPNVGYQFLGEEEASYFTKAGMKILRFLQQSPIWTVGVFGEKWGGGAEFTYFLNQRYDVVSSGLEFDSVTRKPVCREKKNYNQPEIEYAILAGFGAVQELRRLGFGDSVIDEIFLQGLTARRAYELGLSNGISEDEYELLQRAYEICRLKAKYSAPYSAALYELQKQRAYREGINDEKLVQETGETFNPAKNQYVSTGILRLLQRGAAPPAMDLSVRGELPGWKNSYDELF